MKLTQLVKEFTGCLARYCARNPIALGRMEYDEQQRGDAPTDDSGRADGAGSQLVGVFPFLPGALLRK